MYFMNSPLATNNVNVSNVVLQNFQGNVVVDNDCKRKLFEQFTSPKCES